MIGPWALFYSLPNGGTRERAAAFCEGHKKSSAQFQKSCWEEPEKQKKRSCQAQELSGGVSERAIYWFLTDTDTSSRTSRSEKRSAMA